MVFWCFALEGEPSQNSLLANSQKEKRKKKSTAISWNLGYCISTQPQLLSEVPLYSVTSREFGGGAP